MKTIRHVALAALLAMGGALVACGDDSAEADAGNSCEFSGDGVCDEPANCELGTDSADCEAACESGENVHLFAAACAFRSEDDQPTYADPEPSGGDAPQTGFIDRTTVVSSGLDDVDEVERPYRIDVPEYYDPKKAYPLVITMAGHRVDHRVMAPHTDLTHTADLNDFIVVYAAQEFRQGRWAWWTDWDWEERTDENPDFEFIRTIVDEVAADYNLDRRRVYLSGHSRGAAMAFIGAIEMPDLIAGAAVESGFSEFGYLDARLPLGDESLEDDARWDGRRVPLVFIHGVLDDDVCIDCEPGGTCSAAPLRGCAQGMHASDAIVERLEALGWERGEDLVYHRLENVAHRWQSQLNQQWWDFLSARPLSQ
ncbi:MAG: alpha/beta hydrolase family esterase [Persicimonas sp.]